MNASTGALTTVLEFTNKGASNKGAYPQAGLVSDGVGSFWGTTRQGTTSDRGTVYKVNASTGALTTVLSFTYDGVSNKGAYPVAGLVSDGAGFFWGTTQNGGASNYGTVFKVNASTGALATVAQFTFNGSSNKGAYPIAGLVSDGSGSFWGTTYGGGVGGNGTVYKVNASTGALTTVVEFTNNGASNKGAQPYAGLVSDGAGFFWGTTYQGGASNFGTVYKVNASTGALTTLVEFTGNGAQANNGANPMYGALLKHSDGNFYGTTSAGGPGGGGTIFRLRLGPTPVTQPAGAIASISAELNGTVNPNSDGDTAVSFQYGTSPSLNRASVISAGTAPDGGSASAVQAMVSGLLPNTTYYYRVVASNAGNSVPQEGAILSFTTAAAAPSASANGASAITSTSATLNGTVSANGAATSAGYEYGTDAALESGVLASEATTFAAEAATVQNPITVTGLQPHTSYAFRAKATNSVGTSRSDILSFTTLNTAPFAPDGSISAVSGRVKKVALPFATVDADGDAVTLVNVAAGAHLTVNGFSGASAIFTPEADFVGESSLSYTVSDGFGGMATGAVTVNVGSRKLVLEALYSTGGAVPGAGASGSGIPTGATWSHFGTPAINDAGETVFTASVRWPASPGVKAGSATMLFKRSSITAQAQALARVSGAAPGAGSALDLPADAVIAAIGAPQVAADGSILFLATIKGTGVTGASDKLLCWSGGETDSAVLPVARTGRALVGESGAPAAGGTPLKTISSFALTSEGNVALRGALLVGTGMPAVTSADDALVWSWSAATGKARLLLRENSAMFGSTLKSFKTLVSGSGAPGMDRGWFVLNPASGTAKLRAVGTYADKTVRCVEVDCGTGAALTLARTRMTPLDDPQRIESQLHSLGLGAFSWGASNTGILRATLTTGKTGIYRLDFNGMIAVAAQENDAISGLPGVIVRSVRDPIVSADGGQAAWLGALKGSGISSLNDAALFSMGEALGGGTGPVILAREGSQAAECPAGATWRAFQSVAVLGGDVDEDGFVDNAGAGVSVPRIRATLFTATLQQGRGGVTSANDMGLWGTDSSGALRLLLREGQEVGGVTVKNFQALKAASGAGGVTRSCNNAEEVCVLVVASDGSQHLLRIRIP